VPHAPNYTVETGPLLDFSCYFMPWKRDCRGAVEGTSHAHDPNFQGTCPGRCCGSPLKRTSVFSPVGFHVLRDDFATLALVLLGKSGRCGAHLSLVHVAGVQVSTLWVNPHDPDFPRNLSKTLAMDRLIFLTQTYQIGATCKQHVPQLQARWPTRMRCVAWF